MSIVRSGASQKYSEGWEAAFGKKSGKKSAVATARKKPAKNSAKKKKR